MKPTLLILILLTAGCSVPLLKESASKKAEVADWVRGEYWTTWTGTGSTVNSTLVTTEAAEMSFQVFVVGFKGNVTIDYRLKTTTLGVRIVDGSGRLSEGTGGAAYDFTYTGAFDATPTIGAITLHFFNAATPYVTATITEVSDAANPEVINSTVTGQGPRIAAGG